MNGRLSGRVPAAVNDAAYQGHAVKQYRAAQVNTATTAELIVMLYDGAVQFIRQGAAAIVARDWATANARLGRAQDILEELMTGLNRDAGQIAVQLHGLYGYMYDRLVHANVKKDRAPLEEVVTLLTQLREGWQELAHHEARSGRAGAKRA